MYNNNSSDATDTRSLSYGVERTAVSFIKPTVMLVLGVFGSTGNSVVLTLVVKMKTSASHVHRVNKLFIGCLAASDLLFSAFGPFLVGANGLIGTWTFGAVLCKLHQYITVLAGYCSIGMLTLISIER